MTGLGSEERSPTASASSPGFGPAVSSGGPELNTTQPESLDDSLGVPSSFPKVQSPGLEAVANENSLQNKESQVPVENLEAIQSRTANTEKQVFSQPLEGTVVGDPCESLGTQSKSEEESIKVEQSDPTPLQGEEHPLEDPAEKTANESLSAEEAEDEEEPPEKRGCDDARTEVDNGEGQDVMKIGREYVRDEVMPNLLLGICMAAGTTPVFLAGLAHLAEGSFLNVVLAGVVLGMTLIGIWSMVHQLRSLKRQTKARHTAITAVPDYRYLKTIFSPKSVPAWIRFPEYERVEWLNKILVKLWPHINKAASALVKEQLQPVLDTYKIGSITSLHVHGFTLGNIPPRITGVKLIPSKHKLVMEAKVDWRSKPEQKLVLKIKTIGPDFKVQIKRLRMYGILYLVFEPLIDDLPGFGALLFSLKEEPQVDFDIEFMGGDVMALPGIEKMIDGIIRTALIDMLVWPSRLVFPAGPGDYRELQLHPVGQLYVVLQEAKDLMDTDVFGKTDPFAFIYVRQKKDVMKRSTTKQNTLNPVWQEGFFLEVEDPEMQYLTVQIMDDEALEKSELVGATRFPISQLKEGIKWDGWLDLKGDPRETKEGRTRGRVHLQMIYRSYSAETIEEKLPKKAETGDIGNSSAQKKGGKESPRSSHRLRAKIGKPFRFIRSLFHHDPEPSKEEKGTHRVKTTENVS